jgi:hypothetical protein
MEKRADKDYSERRAKHSLDAIQHLLDKNRDRLHKLENDMRKRLKEQNND